jgi:hypothetical protein
MDGAGHAARPGTCTTMAAAAKVTSIAEAVPATAPVAAIAALLAAVAAPGALAVPILADARAAVGIGPANVALAAAIAFVVAADTGATAIVALAAAALPGAATGALPVLFLFLALPLAIERAAVLVLLAGRVIDFARPLGVLRQAEPRPDQSKERRGAAGQARDGGAPVRCPGQHPCPVIEPAVVHASLHTLTGWTEDCRCPWTPVSSPAFHRARFLSSSTMVHFQW